MEGARPVRDEDLPQCQRLIHAAIETVVRLRGGAQVLAELAGSTGGRSTRAGGTGTAGTARDTAANGGGHMPDPNAVLEHWTRTSAHQVFVGTIDDEVVGVAGGHCASHGGDALGIVDWVYVEPDARGVGVGSAMAEALLAWFTARGCRGVDALALPGDRESKQLFESFGLSARLLVLHRPLP